MTRRVTARLAAAGLFTASAVWFGGLPAHADQATLTLHAPAEIAVNDDPAPFSGQLRRTDSTPLTNVVLGVELALVDDHGGESPVYSGWKLSFQEGSGPFQDASLWTYRGEAANEGSSPWHTVEMLGGIRQTFTDTSLDLHFRLTAPQVVNSGLQMKAKMTLRLYPTADGNNPNPSGPDHASSAAALVPIQNYRFEVTTAQTPVRDQPAVLNVKYVNPSKAPVHAGINGISIYNAAGNPEDNGVSRPELRDFTLDYLSPATHRWTPVPLIAAPNVGWGGSTLPPGGFTVPAHGQFTVSFRLTARSGLGYNPRIHFGWYPGDVPGEAAGFLVINYEQPTSPPAAGGGGGAELPVTGGNPMMLGLGAGLLLAAGAGVVLAGRRRRTR